MAGLDRAVARRFSTAPQDVIDVANNNGLLPQKQLERGKPPFVERLERSDRILA